MYRVIMHSAKGSTWEKKDHKYIKKEKTAGGKTQYYYKDSSSGKKSLMSKFKDKVSKVGNSVKNFFTKTLKKKTKEISDEIIEKGKAVINTSKEFKYYAKVKISDTYTRYFYSESEYESFVRNNKEPKDPDADLYDDVLSIDQIYDGMYSKMKIYMMHDERMSDIKAERILNSSNKEKVIADFLGKYVNTSDYPILEGESLSNYVQRLGLIDNYEIKPSNFNDLSKKKNKSSVYDDAKKCNYRNLYEEGYKGDILDSQNFGYNFNCTYSTAAYDLRRRGYDVEASSMSVTSNGTSTQAMEHWYKGSKFEYFDSSARSNNISDYILKNQSNESRGYLVMNWKNGGGHCIAYEVVNGKVMAIDPQTNKVEELSKYSYDNMVSEYSIMRVDSLEPTDNILSAVKNKR